MIGYVNLDIKSERPVYLFYALIAVAGLVLSCLWYRLILSYKQLNSGKFKVVHEIESMLPVRPYAAEWTALGQGYKPNQYKPFTDIELLIPRIFFCIHVIVLAFSVYHLLWE